MSFKTINLYDAKKEKVLQVTFVPSISLLENLGLRNGTKVVVQSRYGFGGPVLCRVENAFAVAIGKDIATQIAVKEVSSK
ncbi:MAG: ferrous iron transport protein A [Defluviitaleaceae bacterium]|nr:ferrous iron transport protein A [Defluviitaleaceae bacterium]